MTIPLLFFAAEDANFLEDRDKYYDGPAADIVGPNVLNPWVHGDLLTVNMLGMAHPEFSSMFQRRESARRFAENQVADYGPDDANTRLPVETAPDCSGGWKFSRTICRIPVRPVRLCSEGRATARPEDLTGGQEIMRKVNVLEFVSLDGVIQAPGGPEEDTSGGFAYGGWIIPHSDAVSSTAIRKEMNMPFDLFLGRKTFDIWAKFWPQHNDIWPAVNTATKYVASNTITSHEWQPSVFLNGDISEKITKIKQQEGPDLHVYGSANLVQTLLKHDLVDAFWLKIFPITLGSGKRLFADGTIPAAFKVTESTVTSNGVIIVNYERVRKQTGFWELGLMPK